MDNFFIEQYLIDRLIYELFVIRITNMNIFD